MPDGRWWWFPSVVEVCHSGDYLNLHVEQPSLTDSKGDAFGCFICEG